jgi:hypothetical protein
MHDLMDGFGSWRYGGCILWNWRIAGRSSQLAVRRFRN